MGKFGYSKNDSRGELATIMVGLSNYNCWDAPVPSGYTVDWFGYILFGAGGGSIVFSGQGHKVGTIQSSTLSSDTQYYFYSYDQDSNLIYSTPASATKKKGEVTFASPFQNGFTTPRGYVLPEIVHQTPSQQRTLKPGSV
jgi:hypothetical protein